MKRVPVKRLEEQQRPDLCPALLDDNLDDLVEQYLVEIGPIPLLSAEEERALALRIREGDAAAKQRFIEANLRLVVHIAKQYSNSSHNLLDMIQDGNIGLMRAVEHFDVTKGYKFSTYAFWWIKQAIRRGLDNTARMVRLPAYLSVRTGMIVRTKERLFEQQGYEPTDEQIAAQMEMDVTTVQQVKSANYRVLSLDKAVSGHDETTLGDLIPDERIPAYDDLLCEEEDERELPQQVREMLTCLTERERRVIILHFGLDGGIEHHGYAEIGRQLGISRERVRQVYESALLKLRLAARSATCIEHRSRQAS
jgi:RNA polymerase primary sigma factor